MMFIWKESLLAYVLILLLGIVTVAILFFKHAYSYWSKRNVLTISPDIPFGNFKPYILQRKSLGEHVTDLYKKVKHTGHPYVGIFMMWRPVLLLLDPEKCKIVLTKEFQHFSSRTVDTNEENDPLAAHLVYLNGKKWKFMRSKLTQTFTSNKIKMMFDTVRACSAELETYLDRHVENDEPLDIKEIMARFTTDIIASTAFGLECNSLKEPDNIFRQQGKRIFEVSIWEFVKSIVIINIPKIASYFKLRRYAKETYKFFTDLVKNMVEYRESNNVSKKDFLELLLQLKNKGYVDDADEENNDENKKLSLEEITAQCFVFFAAGFETSSTTLSSVMYELSIHLDIQDRLRNEINDILNKYDGKVTYEGIMEMSYLENVIDETMRLHPILSVTARRCVSDFTFADTNLKVQAGTSVFIPINSFYTDPEYYPNPEVFDPDRFNPEEKVKRHPYVFLPFGAGPRKCIGLRFAMMQLKVGLVSLLKNHRYTLNSMTNSPLKHDPRVVMNIILGGVWVNAEKIN